VKQENEEFKFAIQICLLVINLTIWDQNICISHQSNFTQNYFY